MRPIPGVQYPPPHLLLDVIMLTQVNKQGVSDRVVDEMNPGQQFTRAQVGVLMSFEDKDVQSITDDDMGAISILTDEDPVLSATLGRHREWITMVSER